MRATFRPLAAWPNEQTTDRRSRVTFKASWSNTMKMLEREISHLAGYDVIVGGGWREQDIRLDGLPRANALEPRFPGVEVSFESIHGRLVYATDVCAYWQHNIRSIALGLEALRAVDRFGVSRRGEQYAGWAQLPAGTDRDAAERGRVLVEQYGSVKAALMATHPDQGGNPRDFADVQAYRKQVGA